MLLQRTTFFKTAALASLFCSALLINSAVAAPLPVDDVKAMFVGHSLINNDMPDLVRQLAQSNENLSMIKAAQIFNGAPLKFNWQNCHQSDFTGEYPPAEFACDALDEAAAGPLTGPFDTLIVTEANNPIAGQHFWNETQLYLEKFTALLKSHDSNGRAYFFTSWEGLDYHQGEWTDAITKELDEYEQIVAEAENISAANGIDADIELIPANLALRELILDIENGQISGLSQRTDVFKDDVHMNDIGNYFIASVVFANIYNRSPEGLTNQIVIQSSGNAVVIEPTLALQLQRLAWTVVTDYQVAKALPGGDNVAPNSAVLTPFNLQTIQLGSTLDFSATASDANGDTDLSYLWDFDGMMAPQLGANIPGVVFNQAGTFDITVLVTDQFGLSDPSPSTVRVIVEEPDMPNLAPNVDSTTPIASQTQVIKVGESLAFSAVASDPDGDTNLTYQWTFATAAPAQAGENTTDVTFNQAGVYEVIVTVTDSRGMSDPTPTMIVVVVEDFAPIVDISSFIAWPVSADGVTEMTWAAPSVVAEVDHYNVNLNSQTMASALSSATRFSLAGLNPHRINHVGITGVDASGRIVAQSPVIELAAIVVDTTTTPNQKSALGINLTGVSYWSTQWMLIDVMRQASNGSGELWATGNAQTYAFNTGHQARLDLDAQGWPKSLPPSDDPDFHHVTTIIYQDNEHYPVGEYVVLYDGEGELRYNGATHLVEKSSPGRDVLQLNANSYLHLSIRQTDPAGTGNYLKNVRILVPGGICGFTPSDYAESADECNTAVDYHSFEQIYRHQDFHPLFLADMAKYRSIRFMQMMRTNVSEQNVWADRASYDDVSWSLNAGAPYEIAIDLANKVQAEPWLNVPARVDENYMIILAQMVKTQLDPHLDVHVELGNEVWNNAYPYNLDARWMEEQGRSQWPDAGVDDFMYRLNYYGKRSSDMCEVFKREFAEQADRVKCVVATQGGNAWVGEQILACRLWAAENGGQNCAHNIDSLAIGPYFAGYLADEKNLPILAQWANEGTSGMSKLFDEINTGLLRDLTYDPTEPDWMQAPVAGSLAQAQRFMVDNKAVADRYGIKLSAYEGGQHMTFTGNLTGDRALINENLFLAGNRDPRMGQAFSNYFTDWKEAGGSLFMVFESTGKWGRFGAFSLKEHQQQALSETPKLADTLAFIDANPCWWTGCDRMTYPYTTVTVDPLPDTSTPSAGFVISADVRPDTWGVSLSWSYVDADVIADVQFFQVFRDGEFVGHTNADGTGFNNDWLQLHTYYSFQVRAVNAAGVMLMESNIVTLQAGDSVAPSQPGGLAVTYDGEYGFNVTWDASTDDNGVAYYKIKRNGEDYTIREGLLLDENWPPQGEVSYQIIAVDHFHNESEPSVIVSNVVPPLN